MTVEQMLSRDEIECAAARSFGNKDFQVQQYEAWDSWSCCSVLWSPLNSPVCNNVTMLCYVVESCDLKST